MDFFNYINSIFNNFVPARIFPSIIAVLLIFFFIYYFKALRPEQGTVEWMTMRMQVKNLTFFNQRYPMTKTDIIPLCLITLFFLSLAFINLGDTISVDVLREVEESSFDRTHLNNMYFDEIYFTRTAVEHIENVNPYETTHPPLGKEIIAVSILLFGMSPFGWRLLGALFGVLILIVMYVFLKNLFGKTIVSICGTLLFGFDFMRFVQTRISTIDTYVVFFILLSFFFMYRYVTINADAPFRKSLLPLAMSGVFFGLICTVKWVGLYAGAGLLVIYIIHLFQLGFNYSNSKRRDFGEYLAITLFSSIIFFVVIPAVIYYLTYIPYGLARGMTLRGGMLWDPDFVQLVWNNQLLMYSYHSWLVAEHPFSSVWWQWILNIRPVLYVNNYSGDLRATFGVFGNPVVWWGGFLAIIAMIVRLFRHRDGKALFILIGFLSQLLPWIAVERILFAYHYFPSTLFLILSTAHVFNSILERNKNGAGKLAVYAYTIVSGVVFAMFYPMLAGFYLPDRYYDIFIKWLPTWPF